MNTQSLWAAQMLHLAPNRAVADALFAQVADADMHRIARWPSCGISLPRTKMTAERAVAAAAGIVDPADIARAGRDPRKGVRRTLACNRHADPAWSSSLLERAHGEDDWDTFNAALRTAHFSTVLALLSQPTWASKYVPHHVRHHVLADRIAAATWDERVAVANLVAAERPIPTTPGVYTGYRSSPGQVYVEGLGAGNDLAALCQRVPGAAPAVLWWALTNRHVDLALAQVAVEHADGIQRLVDRYLNGRITGEYLTRFGLGFQATDEDAGDLLAGCPQPAVASVVAFSPTVTGAQIDTLLEVGHDRVLPPLVFNPTITPNARSGRMSVLGHGPATPRRLSEDQCHRLAQRLVAVTTETELLSELLASGHPFAADDVGALLRKGIWRHVSDWLLGNWGDLRPYPGQVTALWPHIGGKAFSASATVNLTLEVVQRGLPWADELLEQCMQVPLISGTFDDLPGQLTGRISAFIGPVLGTDPEAWVTFTSLAPRFAGNVEELAATALAVAS